MTAEPDAGTPAPRRKRRRRRSRITRWGPVAWLLGALASGGVWLITTLGRERAMRVSLFTVKLVAPLVKETRTARRNLALAFPEKNVAEREAIIKGCWANFARVIVEFMFLEDICVYDWDHPLDGYFTAEGTPYFNAVRDDGKTAVIFAAHLANWELVATAGKLFGVNLIIPFRAPGQETVGERMFERRSRLMGRLVPNARGATFEIASAMEAGVHLAMLIDQRLWGGLAVPFFGRPALTNPLPAAMARKFNCPVHGARSIRRPDGRIHVEFTPEIPMPRDAEGLIDVKAATALMTSVVEGWVREHPEQWFWLHDRWKM